MPVVGNFAFITIVVSFLLKTHRHYDLKFCRLQVICNHPNCQSISIQFGFILASTDVTLNECDEHHVTMVILTIVILSQSCIAMAKKRKFSQRNKQTAIKYHHFVEKTIVINSIDTKEQTAEILTKLLEVCGW